MEPKNPKFKKLTAAQTAGVYNLIAAHILPSPVKADAFVYADGWSDDRIAKETLADYPGVARTVVCNMRLREFGPLDNIGPPKELWERVERLEETVADLVRRLGGQSELLIRETA